LKTQTNKKTGIAFYGDTRFFYLLTQFNKIAWIRIDMLPVYNQ